MPSRSDLTISARATRSASRSQVPTQPSKAVKQQAEPIVKAEGSTNRTPRSRVIKATDRKPSLNPRPRSRQARVKSPESPLIKVKDEEGDDNDAKRAGPPQQQQSQDKAGPSYPLATQLGGWQWLPAGHSLSNNFHQGTLTLPELYPGATGISTALQEL